MGKASGFMEYERMENPVIAAERRSLSFDEFHEFYDEDVRICQAARCMDCGVPFCQSAMKLNGFVTGCPLHNLIPEWNDAVYKGHDGHALSRLIKVNPFPEFTGRVCPALCEKACINGCFGDPVTIKDNELYIIEKAFEKGAMNAQPPKNRSKKRIAIVGSGPAGLAAAYKLNRRGHNVTVYERDDRIGGLLMYGIPNMKLDKSVILRRQALFKAEGIEFVCGCEVGEDISFDELKEKNDALILCCGAKKPRPVDCADPDKLGGVYYAVDFLKEVTKGVLKGGIDKKLISQVKGRHVVVIGGGDTGNDCIGTCVRLCAESVTALEMTAMPSKERRADNPWPEWPRVLRTDYGHEEAAWKYGSDPRVFETTAVSVSEKKGRISGITTANVEFKDGRLKTKEGSEKELKCELLLIAAGFIGTEDKLMDKAGIARTPRGNIATSDEEHYMTNIPGVFTAGDAHRGQSLVVWAISEGLACAAEVDAYLMGYTNI